jgi:L-lactate utilization protein LutC
MDQYASQSLGRPFNVLKEQSLPATADQLLAAVAQHVHQDTETTFKAVVPVIQQAMDAIKQLSGQQPPDPATQAFLQTSMAETQRLAAKDQADAQLKAAELQQKNQQFLIKTKTDMAENTENNLTQERIKSAELTRDAANLQHEQVKTAIAAQNDIQQTLGAQNG